MKLIVLALAFLLAGSNADQTPPELTDLSNAELPQPIGDLNALDENELNQEEVNDDYAVNENEEVPSDSDHNSYIIRPIITNVIKSRVYWVKQSISEPSKAPNLSVSLTKNDRGLAAYLKNVEVRGLSNINIDDINVNIWGTKATTVLRLPKIELDLGKIGVDHTVFGSKLTAVASGTVSLSNLVIVFDAVFNPIPLTVKNVEVSIKFIGTVKSNLKVKLLGADISRTFNDFVEKVIPTVLSENKGELEDILKGVAFPYKDLTVPHDPTFFYL